MGLVSYLKIKENPIHVTHHILIPIVIIVASLNAAGFTSAATRQPIAAHIQVQESRSGAHLDQLVDTMRHDDGRPFYAFRFPDVYGDDWRNMRFRAPANSRLMTVGFAFGTRGFSEWTTGDPALLTRIWPMGEDSLPTADSPWLTDTTDFSSFASSIFSLDSTWHDQPSQFVWVDLTMYGITLDSGQWFHVGYSAILNSSDDSLSVLADDGSPASPYASEWYNGRFTRISESWPAVNFFVRVVLDRGESGVQTIAPAGVAQDFELGPVWPNPFNSRCTISYFIPQAGFVRLSVYDVLGCERTVLVRDNQLPGLHEAYWNAADFASGSYFIRMQSSKTLRTIPVFLAK